MADKPKQYQYRNMKQEDQERKEMTGKAKLNESTFEAAAAVSGTSSME